MTPDVRNDPVWFPLLECHADDGGSCPVVKYPGGAIALVPTAPVLCDIERTQTCQRPRKSSSIERSNRSFRVLHDLNRARHEWWLHTDDRHSPRVSAHNPELASESPSALCERYRFNNAIVTYTKT